MAPVYVEGPMIHKLASQSGEDFMVSGIKFGFRYPHFHNKAEGYIKAKSYSPARELEDGKVGSIRMNSTNIDHLFPPELALRLKSFEEIELMDGDKIKIGSTLFVGKSSKDLK